MKNKIILASSSGVRKKILNKNGIDCEVVPPNIDEDQVKESLIKEKETTRNNFQKSCRIKSKQGKCKKK